MKLEMIQEKKKGRKGDQDIVCICTDSPKRKRLLSLQIYNRKEMWKKWVSVLRIDEGQI